MTPIKELTESQIIDSINNKKRQKAKGFKHTESLSGVVKVTDSVDAGEAAEEVEDSEVVKDTTEPEANNITINPVQLQSVVEAAINNAINPLKEELATTKQQLDANQAELTEAKTQLAQSKTELEEAKNEAKTLADISKLFGKNAVTVPNVNKVTSVSSDKPEGLLKDAFDLLSVKAYKTNPRTGAVSGVHDFRQLDKLVKRNRVQILDDLETYAKKNGLLQGDLTKVTDAVTTGANIDGGFLAVLSSLMRTNNRGNFIYWQFPTTRFEFSKGEGDTIKVPRAAYQPVGVTSEDWLLSGNGSFYNIDSSSQNISTGTVSITLKEYGLGKNSTYPPVGIPAFVSAYSMIDLMSILERNLVYNYYQFEDKVIRELWDKTSAVIYNDKNNPTATVGDVLAGDIGTMTDKFLNNLRAYMLGQQILTLPDGNYGLAAHPKAVAQLKESLKDSYHFSPVSEAQLVELANIMNPTMFGPNDKLTGYVGKFEGFHIFETNSSSVGAAGNPGVQTETIGGGSNTTRTSYAFGAETIGRGIGTAMEIRKDDITNFQRVDRFTWISHEGVDALDVDPTGYNDTSAVPQQLRVLDVRTTDVAV